MICAPCKTGRHYDCGHKIYPQFVLCDCDTCTSIREDVLNDKLADLEGEKS